VPAPSVSPLARLGVFIEEELGPRPGRLRAALRIVVPSLCGAVLIMLFQIPHGGWAILSIFTVSQADAGASLQRGLERLLGTIAGGPLGDRFGRGESAHACFPSSAASTRTHATCMSRRRGEEE
jgi:uncharacterized membrane protein YccC